MELKINLSEAQVKALNLLNIAENDAQQIAFSSFKSQIKSRINQLASKAEETNSAIYEAAVRSGFQAPSSKEDFVRNQTNVIRDVLREL